MKNIRKETRSFIALVLAFIMAFSFNILPVFADQVVKDVSKNDTYFVGDQVWIDGNTYFKSGNEVSTIFQRVGEDYDLSEPREVAEFYYYDEFGWIISMKGIGFILDEPEGVTADPDVEPIGFKVADDSGDGSSIDSFIRFEAVYDLTVTWIDSDGTILKKQNVEYGEVPVYDADGGHPVKDSDDQYTYTFAGWTPTVSVVKCSTTYKATYTSSINKYPITFSNEGVVLQKSDVEYGSTPVYNGETPTKERTALYYYVFDGWNPDIKPATGAAIYLAKFKEELNKYTVTFDGLAESQVVEAGKKAVKPADPTKDGFIFLGWTKDGETFNFNSEILSDIELKAFWQEKVAETTESEIPVTVEGLAEAIDTSDLSEDQFVTATIDVDKTSTVSEAVEGKTSEITGGNTSYDVNYLTIDISKVISTIGEDGITSGSPILIGELDDPIEIAIPLSSLGITTLPEQITVVREHQGKVEEFIGINTRPIAGLYVDATYYLDESNLILYVYASKFSTYGVISKKYVAPITTPIVTPVITPVVTPVITPVVTPTVTPSPKPEVTAAPASAKTTNTIAINDGLSGKQKGSKLTMSWGKVEGAAYYEVYVTYCGKKYPTEPTLVCDADTFKATIKELNGEAIKTNKNLKFYVVALDSKGKMISKTIKAHVAGSKTNHSDAKSIKVVAKEYILAVTDTCPITVEIELEDKDKEAVCHVALVRYKSSNKNVARVTSDGQIIPVAKGTCYIYVYANNGTCSKVKVTVE